MKKKIRLFALFLGVNSLYAGTMGVSTYTMDGFYAGLGAGINTLFTKDSFSTLRLSGQGGNVDFNRYTNSSILFTGEIGYGKMVQPKTYLGVKGSIYYTPINNLTETGFSNLGGTDVLIVGNNSITTQLRPIYNLDAVLGYEVWEHILPFVEAGISFADVRNSYTSKRTRTNVVTATNVKYEYDLSLDSYQTGFNIGIGANYQPHPNWILSSELVYNYLGKNTGSVSNVIPGVGDTEIHTRSVKGNDLALFGSISYLF